MLRPAVVAATLVIAVAAARTTVHPVSAAEALRDHDSSRLPEIARRIGPDARLLSENPYVPVSLGQKPVVLDPFMLWTIARDHPDWRDDLVRRLNGHEFDAVVLFSRLDDPRARYGTHHLGQAIADAIAQNYRPRGAWQTCGSTVPPFVDHDRGRPLEGRYQRDSPGSQA